MNTYNYLNQTIKKNLYYSKIIITYNKNIYFKNFEKYLSDGETTQSQLTEVLYRTQTENKMLPGFDSNRDDVEYYRIQQDIDCDEVYPRIYIGDA